MNLEIIKQQIRTLVDASKDEVLLQNELKILSDHNSIENETYYSKRLEESIQKANTDKILLSKNVHQMVKQRVLACTKSLNEAWETETMNARMLS